MVSIQESEKKLSYPVADVETGEQDGSVPPEIVDSSFSDKTWKSALSHVIPIGIICLLVWLDEGILATAIPSISDEFKSFDQIGWYGPSYLFGLCASQLPFGRAYKDFPSKITYMVSLLIFEMVSIIQAAAPFSEAFIVGRVFAGMGGAALTIFSEEIPKSKLPYVMGTFGLVHSVGGIAGPVIGGAITSSSLTWRWYSFFPRLAEYAD
ncbi:major facilitator superfamily transporter protein [Rutstroemia sp. NJR-2017a BBW]|nr:major facilitator superfamily transporter protein [Rutstroemia sp. NJR-2017a BBW]